MTEKQLLDWLSAAAACAPGRWGGLRRRVRGAGPWQVGVPSGAGLRRLWLRRTPGALLGWDAAAGTPIQAPKAVRRARPFAAAMKDMPELRPAFAALASLCPVSALVTEWSGGAPRPEWSLVFERPVAWPFFARLDVAKPFEAEPLLGYLLLDLKVAEVRFDEGGARAYVQA